MSLKPALGINKAINDELISPYHNQNCAQTQTLPIGHDDQDFSFWTLFAAREVVEKYNFRWQSHTFGKSGLGEIISSDL